MELPALGAPRSPAGAGRLGQFHLELTAVELVAIEARDRLLSLLGRGHLDEAEPARLAGVPVGHDRGGLHNTGLGEEFPETFRGRGERETADEKFLSHCASPWGIFRGESIAQRTRKKAPGRG